MTPNCPPPGRKRQRFAERRKAMGLSQERLAEAVGVDPSTVARWERGETEPQAVHRPRLAKALHLTTEDVGKLLAEADEPPPVEPVVGAAPAEVGNDELDALELAGGWRPAT